MATLTPLEKFLRNALLVFLFGLITVIVLAAWEFTTVARLDAGQGFQICVIADTPWHVDPIRGYYCEVHRGSSTDIEKCYIGCGDSPVSFELRTSSDRNLVALVESSAPNIVLAMFDTTTAEFWPDGNDSYEERRTPTYRGKVLMKRLQQSHPDTAFILAEDAPHGASKL